MRRCINHALAIAGILSLLTGTWFSTTEARPNASQATTSDHGLPALRWIAEGSLVGTGGEVVYIRRLDQAANGSLDSILTGIEVSSGTIRSEQNLGWTGALVIDNGIAYTVIGRDLVAIDAETGEEKWRKQTAAETLGGDGLVSFSRPTIVDDVIYVDDIDDQIANVYALDAATGNELWRTQTEAMEGYALPVVDGSVYVSDLSGTLHAIDAATGQTRWSTLTGASGYGAPSIAGDTVFDTGYTQSESGQQSYGYTVDVATGAERWRYPLTPEMGMTAKGEMIFVTESSSLVALDPLTGGETWSFDGPAESSIGEIAPTSDLVFVVSYDQASEDTRGTVYALDAATGDVRWHLVSSQERTRIHPSPIDSNGIVYLGEGNLLTAVDTETGSRLWQTRIGGRIQSSPVEIDGTVFVEGSDGFVYAIDPVGGDLPEDIVRPAPANWTDEQVLSTTFLAYQLTEGVTAELWQVTYAPGASGSIPLSAQTIAGTVLTGSITFDAPISIYVDGTQRGVQDVFGAGQQFAVSTEIVRNNGSQPATLLVSAVVVSESNIPLSDQEGITIEPFATIDIPEPWGWGPTIEVRRLTIPPGAQLPPTLTTRPELILVETGAIQITTNGSDDPLELRAGEFAPFTPRILRVATNLNEGPLQILTIEVSGDTRGLIGRAGGCGGRCLSYRGRDGR